MLYTFAHSKRQRKQLPLTINLAGYDHLQEPVWRSKNFDLFQWIYCVDGMGEFTLHNKKVILKPGQMVLIYPHEPHSYHAVTPEWHVHIIGFSGNCSYELMKTFRMHQSGIYHFQKPEVFKEYLQKIIMKKKDMELLNEKQNSAARREHLRTLSKICYDFLLELSFSVEFISSSTPSSDNEKIRMMITYMEEHFQELITLDQLAELVNLSRSHISELFKKEMHQSIITYLTALRISQARIMLYEYPEMHVTEVGKKCGFENPSYFGKVFKRIVGVTPMEYRML